MKACQDDAQRAGERDRQLLEARRARKARRNHQEPRAAAIVQVRRLARLMFRRAAEPASQPARPASKADHDVRSACSARRLALSSIRPDRRIGRAAVGEHLATASSAATGERLRRTSIPAWPGIEGILREPDHPERQVIRLNRERITRAAVVVRHHPQGRTPW